MTTTDEKEATTATTNDSGGGSPTSSGHPSEKASSDGAASSSSDVAAAGGSSSEKAKNDADGIDIDALARAVQEKVRVSDDTASVAVAAVKEEAAVVVEVVEEEVEDDLEDVPDCLKQAADWIRRSDRILIVSGAGVSVAAGIPDFRTPGSGLYDNLATYNLPYPEAVFAIDFYKKNPDPFVHLASELWPGQGKHHPTLTHAFVSLLSKRGKLLRDYSQNIDGLEHQAGIDADRLVECHGHFRTAACIRCHAQAPDIDAVKDSILRREVPRCQSCKQPDNYVKPDIVFFGEDLPPRFHEHLPQDVKEADLCLVLGTSLMVAPVSNIPYMTDKKKCRRLLLNREHVGNIGYDPAGPKFRKLSAREKDLFCPGNCDDSVAQIARVLGWTKKLERMQKRAAARSNGSDDDDDGAGADADADSSSSSEEEKTHGQKSREFYSTSKGFGSFGVG